MKNLVLFASGDGSNAENLIVHFSESDRVRVRAVFVNRATAGVIDRCLRLGVPYVLFSKQELTEGIVLQKLESFKPDFIVLAGFLLKVPDEILERYPNKIVNIHPALLPKYGGKGMYGNLVHERVFENKDALSGISIHYVNGVYDAGDIIFQADVDVSDCKTPDAIAARVRALEQEHFPRVVEELLVRE